MEDPVLPESGAPTANFIGRARELAELRAGLDDAIEGRGRVFLLAGEPGIGKTRLAEELARHAVKRGIQVLWGRCWEGGGAPAYWPLIQIVRGCFEGRDAGQVEVLLGAGTREISQLVPEFRSTRQSTDEPRTASDPQAARFRLFGSVATLLKNVARIAPLLVIIEDLHDADQPSLELLRFIARETKGARIVIVGSFREAEVRQSPELGKLVGDLIREALTIPLSGLSQNEIGQFIERSSGHRANEPLVAELYKATNGNPLYVDGIVRLLIAEGMGDRAASGFEIPLGVREAIRRRLAMLPEKANAALSIASIIGNDFDPRLLERVSGSSAPQLAEQLEEAARIGIVTSGARPNPPWRFTHALVREVLYRDLSPNRRIEIHARIAVALEKTYHDDLKPHLAALAYHFTAANEVAKAIDYSISAGTAAAEVFAYHAARSHWETALELMKAQSASGEQRAALARELSSLCFSIDYESAIRYAHEALVLYESLGDQAGAGECHSSLGMNYAVPYERTTDIALAREHFRKAEAILSKRPEGLALARVYTGITQIAFVNRRTAEGVSAGKRAMQLAERFHDEARWAGTGIQYALHLVATGQLAECRAVQERAWQIIDRLNIASLGFISSWSGGTCAVFFLDPRDAQRWYERELGKPRVALYRPFLQALLGDALARAGDLEGARRLPRATPLVEARADFLFCEGRWDEAEALIKQQAPNLRRAGDLASLAICLNILANICRVSGRADEALGVFEDFFATGNGEAQIGYEILVRPVCAALHALAGRMGDAERELARCREIMAHGEDWRGLAGGVARGEAVLAAAQGRIKQATDHFEKAVEIFRRYQVPFEEADTLCYWGQALIAAGDETRANEKFDSAIAIYRRCASGEKWIERVEAMSATAASAIRISPAKLDAKSGAPPTEAEFRSEGDYWTMSWGGKTSRLKERKGFAFIAWLLRHPGQEFPAAELVAVVEAVSLRMPAETEMRNGEASVALRLERARLAVTKNVKSAIDKIREETPEMGRHLAQSIRTGKFCAYLPKAPTTWRF
ncbi:MAG TPA: AAA family ATPase [Candidatus Binataceae bacterium]|nr:AAA family ATPase [Candidatus Binataceae bacterium]